MTKKKKSNNGAGAIDGPASEKSATPSTPDASLDVNTLQPAAKSKPPDPSTSALIICRNKHWRYISSFHGPWLQLPPEVLESLAFSNYDSPRPLPIDPAVFFDLVKVRRLVEEATDLAVRAANGTTSSALSSSLSAGNGILGGGGAAALGLGIGGGGPNTKLSRERKHRMREQATQKLSRAYQFDEIAASVATMQGASSLEEVAKLVLQRSANDTDAKYVHFFHEKIPSRMLAQCTTLEPLDQVIQDRPTEGALLRTRAVTRIFKDDYAGAARDLTEALSVCRYTMAQHKVGRGQLELANALEGSERTTGGARDRKYEAAKIEEADQPSSLETQLLFHRAGVYLARACQNVNTSLDGLKAAQEPSASQPDVPQTLADKEAYDRRLEARKMVKTNAKRALRDYLGFLSHFDYTPGLPAEITQELFRKFNAAAGSYAKPKGTPPANRLLEMSGNSNLSNGHLSDALVPHKGNDRHQLRASSSGHYENPYAGLPLPEIHPVSSLFSSSSPDDLPPYPATSQALVPRKPFSAQKNMNGIANHFMAQSEQHEAVTYHPLFTDALHSLLLCHSLIQTSPKEHLRHAHMVARLARVCDGYPIFLAARSPSRADWIEVVRRANNWIGLQQSWETLCAPAPLPSHAGATKKEETEEQAKERRRQEAILEALADERVHDEASFQAAVAARERRAEEQRREELGQDGNSPKRWAQEDGKEYPISTERAEAIARWVREAPLTVAGVGKTKRGPKKGKGRKEPEHVASDLTAGVNHLAVSNDVEKSFDL
ncbi:MAG: hypothetical protein ASARMPREDX12_006442 [Alectoria sarmentosa]|nr:MAG: hypothetical protein ASARMPRED_003565 [Alectoria sarmentosa]CAD6592766.1 MAG: hypothetical protein ASARMPREDX12_006442 [Alectoria sarmentosa]